MEFFLSLLENEIEYNFTMIFGYIFTLESLKFWYIKVFGVYYVTDAVQTVKVLVIGSIVIVDTLTQTTQMNIKRNKL